MQMEKRLNFISCILLLVEREQSRCWGLWSDTKSKISICKHNNSPTFQILVFFSFQVILSLTRTHFYIIYIETHLLCCLALHMPVLEIKQQSFLKGGKRLTSQNKALFWECGSLFLNRYDKIFWSSTQVENETRIHPPRKVFKLETIHICAL